MSGASRVQWLFFCWTLLLHVQLFLEVEAQHQSVPYGPADVTLKNVDQCSEPDQYPTKTYITRRKVNRTQDAFDGNVSLSCDWDESISLNINVAKFGDGGYKPNYFILDNKDSCNYIMNKVENGFKKILRESNLPEVCPVKQNLLIVKDYIVDYQELPETLLYGDFRVDIKFQQDGKDLSCIRGYVLSKPKKPYAG